MHIAKVVSTLPDLSTATNPCFTSSVKNATPAPKVPVEAARTTFLLRAIFVNGFLALEENSAIFAPKVTRF